MVTNKNELNNKYSSTKWAFIGLALLAIIWGYNWVILKKGMAYSEPFAFSAIRTFFGALVLFILAAILKQPLKIPPLRYMIPLGIFQTSGFIGLVSWAIVSGAAGRTSVLTYTMPFWVLIMAWPILNEKIRGIQWLAVVSALVGLVLIISPWNMSGSLKSNLIALASGFSWGVSSILLKLMQRKHTIHTLPYLAWQMMIGLIPLLIVAIIRFDGGPTWSGYFIFALAFCVIPGGAIAWMLWMHAIKILPAGTAGISSLAIPVIGVISAWIQLHERPNLYEALGMLLIVLALAVLTAREILLSRHVDGIDSS